MGVLSGFTWFYIVVLQCVTLFFSDFIGSQR